MATGFVQRWKGKVLAQLLGVGSGGITAYTASAGAVNVSPNDIASIYGRGTANGTASTATLTVAGSGLTKLSSVGGSTYALGAPVLGRTATIYTDAIGDGVRKVNASPATFVSTLSGAGFLNFSTAAVQSVTLRGLSTASWLIQDNVGSVSASTS